MARRFGNAGVSSLLSAAQASYDKTQTYNDQIAGYQFDLSPKTEADFQTYNDYLSKRAKTIQDPSKLLSLQKTQTSAYRTFNSAEIGRATTAVKYGDISNRDKYAHMDQLYQQAVANGDQNLAQSIDNQLASLSVTIQNEDAAKAAAAERATASGTAAYHKGISQAVGEANRVGNAINEAYRTGQELTYIDPKTGQPVTTYVTSNNKDALLGKVKQYQAGIYQQAITDGMDESGAYGTTLSGIQASPEYIKATNGRQDTLAGNGVNPQLTSYDEYGIPKTENAPLDHNKVIGTDEQGRPIFAAQTGVNGSDFIFNRQVSKTSQGEGGLDTIKTQISTDPQGNKFYHDPITGKKVLVSESTVSASDKNLLDQGYKPGDKVFTHQLDGAAGQPAIADPHALNRAAASNTINGIGNAIGGTVNRGVGATLNFLTGGKEVKQEQARLAELESQKMVLAAQQSLRNSTAPAVRAAQPGPVATYVPKAPASQLYLPTPIGQAPAQVYAAALPANSNDSQKAAALGKAVGYNF